VRLLFASILIALPLVSADSHVSGPVLGYAYDASARLTRPMFGLPGAASFGKPAATSLAKAVISPAHDYVLGVDADGQMVRADLSSGAVIAIAGAKSNPDQLIMSPSGAAAVVYHAATASIQVVSSLRSTPEIKFEDHAMGDPTGLAVSDDGDVVLYGVVESASTALYRSRRDGGTARLGSVGNIAANTFMTQSQEAVFAQSDGTVVLIAIDGGVSVIGNVEQPSAIAVSPDNTRIFVGSAQRRTVNTIGRLSGTAVWLLDATGPAPITFFVPAPESVNE
jgi:DNA-binding beta-propeller fold protein YncE